MQRKSSVGYVKSALLVSLSFWVATAGGWAAAREATPAAATVAAPVAAPVTPGAVTSGAGAAATSTGLSGLTLEQVLARADQANGTAQMLAAAAMSARMALLVTLDNQTVLLSQHDFLYDFARGRLKVTNYEGNQVTSVDVVTPRDAFVLTEKTGPVPMPRKQAAEYRRTLTLTRLGLAAARQPGSQTRLLGPQQWPELKLSGTAIELKYLDETTTFLLNDQGLVIAEKFELEGSLVLAAHRTFQSVQGVTTPTVTVITDLKGEPLLTIKYSDVKLNPSFTEAEFEVNK